VAKAEELLNFQRRCGDAFFQYQTEEGKEANEANEAHP